VPASSAAAGFPSSDAERVIGERRISSDHGRSGCARADLASYFRPYVSLSDEAARETALSIWAEVNGPNLEQDILPTRGRATLVLEQGADHAVRRVRLRKL
jgi:hypothetical protein